MIRAILFDMGGTLDGEGQHWLDRFIALYRIVGIRLSREEVRAAFGEAERRAAGDEIIATANLEKMVDRHVAWQLAYLGIHDHDIQRGLVDRFIATVHAVTTANARLLAELRGQGFGLGIVSNGCGNLEVLCAEFGYTPYLSVAVDSRKAALRKPDPAIFVHAAEAMAAIPSTVIMVGDSFENDVRPAKHVGMCTAWLEGPDGGNCPDPSLVDVRLRRLADLPAALSAMPLAIA